MPTYGGLLDAVRGVHWPARRTVTAGFAGAHHSATRGTSTEFAEYRAYRQGDDPRRLDWRLLARSDRAYIRLATDRVVLPTTLVLDTSSSMAFPVLTYDKWRVAQAIAVGLAAVAHGDGDPVGLALYDVRGAVRVVPPSTRRDLVAELTRVIDAADADGVLPLAPLVEFARRGRVAIITDLLGDADDVLRCAARHATAGGEVHLVHVVARDELDPPRRPMLAQDPERPGVQRFLVEATRRAYEHAFGEWRSAMARRWRDAGATYVEVITDEPAAHAVRRIVRSAEGASST